ncbi:uncharacterized protein DS421_3g81290 [Arachis hypogaea]|nr:uncharacterized protein DS421_3g81290 [Arachis hypogaea]
MQKGEATLPSTRADCPLGRQHKGTKKRRQPCPAHSKGRAQNVPWDQEEENLALPSTRAVSGSPRKEFKGKMSPMHATRFEQGTMRKLGLKVDCRAKKPRKLIERVPQPCFEHGTAKWKHCPALREGRAAFCVWRTKKQIWRTMARSWQHLAHQAQSWQHQNFLPCPPRGQGSILCTKEISGAPNFDSGAPTFPALPLARAGQHFMHQGRTNRTKAAPACTTPHQSSAPCTNFLPCPPQGQGSLLGVTILGRKI